MEEKYAFLMLDYETPGFIEELHNKIPDIEIYSAEGYGLEYKTHVTVVPCLSNDVDINEIKALCSPLSSYKAVLPTISYFECPEYDVLKSDVHCEELYKTNALIRSKFETFTEYKDYHPHMTIAYMKKGFAKKYSIDMLPKIIVLEPTNFTFSYYENGVEKEIKWE